MKALAIGLFAVLAGALPLHADVVAGEPQTTLAEAVQVQELPVIVGHLDPISQETLVRRNLAQATFCLPQNVVGILFRAWLELTGGVVETATINEVTIVVTKEPIGVSLGSFVFVGKSVLSENVVRHEVGHTLQGYRHGPFYLLLEGSASIVQVAISLISRTFARGYFTRWPEDEANTLGGVR